jgi:hypothetical protein
MDAAQIAALGDLPENQPRFELACCCGMLPLAICRHVHDSFETLEIDLTLEPR